MLCALLTKNQERRTKNHVLRTFFNSARTSFLWVAGWLLTCWRGKMGRGVRSQKTPVASWQLAVGTELKEFRESENSRLKYPFGGSAIGCEAYSHPVKQEITLSRYSSKELLGFPIDSPDFISPRRRLCAGFGKSGRMGHGLGRQLAGISYQSSGKRRKHRFVRYQLQVTG